MNSKIINGKYYKLKTLGCGGQGKVYLIEDENSDKFIAKIIEDPNLKKHKEYIEDQSETNRKIKLFQKINIISSPYLTRFIEGGEGEISKNDQLICKRTYYIFEYCKYGDLCLFVYLAGGFEEKINKLIFKKIVLGVKALHEAGIYHRDLKLDNIVIDECFNPKICDYDMCTDETGKLRDRCGTKSHIPPQKFENREYSCDKADIFSLGCLLYSLIVHDKSFSCTTKEDSLYKYVIENRKYDFFKALKMESYNENFKDLYYSMIAYKEEDRPTLDKILNSEWLDEINKMNIEEKQQLENHIKTEIINKKKYIDFVLKEEPIFLKNSGYLTSSINKGSQTDENYKKEYFKQSLYIDYIDIDLEGEIYIKINGDFDYYEYMNCFVNEIDKKEKCQILVQGDGYKCNIYFNENEKDVENNNESLIIKLKLYKTGEKEYLMRFLRISGGLFEYYEKVKNISSLGKELIKEKFFES